MNAAVASALTRDSRLWPPLWSFLNAHPQLTSLWLASRVALRDASIVALPYIKALLVSALATVIAFPIYPHLDLVNIVMVYLLGTAWSGLRLGRSASALCAITSVAAFDFFFVPPRFSFDVADIQYVFVLAAMLGVGLVIAQLTASVRQQAEAAAESRAAAERAALCNTLLASISHDLRGPLTAIAGAGSLVAAASHAMDRQGRELLGSLIEEKARDMSGLLNNILDLMRLETASAPLNAEWESLEELVGTALRRNEARLAALHIVTRIPAELPPVYVDGQLIVQLLSNLLENAGKYAPRGATLTVAAGMRDGGVRLTVEDDGPGFGVRDPESLFERFARGDASDRVGGMGLGLAICRAIAKLHDGDIRAMTGSQGGARFEIALPRRIHAPVEHIRGCAAQGRLR